MPTTRSLWTTAHRAARIGITPHLGVYDLGMTRGGTRRLVDGGECPISVFTVALVRAGQKRCDGDKSGARRALRAARDIRPIAPHTIYGEPSQ